MCPNDWEWGGLSWSINFDCLPNDYSSANNSAAACARTDTNMIHEGFPLRATLWFSRCRTPTRDRYLREWGGRASQQLVWLFICLSRASSQAWCDNSTAGVCERVMMILSDDDVHVGKVRGRVTEELPDAESRSTRCGCRWCPRVRWQHLYRLRLLYRSKDNLSVLYFFVVFSQPLPSTNHIWHQNTT